MSIRLSTKTTLPPLGGGPMARANRHQMPALKEPAVPRSVGTFKTKKIRKEDVQILLKFLRETCDLGLTTTPADTVCKLQHRMTAADSKIKRIKQQLRDHNVLLFAAQEALDLGPEVNPVQGEDKLLHVCKEIAGVSGHHSPEGIANFLRSNWSKKQLAISRLQATIQKLREDLSQAEKDPRPQQESLMHPAEATTIGTADGQSWSVISDLEHTCRALKADIDSLNDIVKTKDNLIKDLEFREEDQSKRIRELQSETADLNTKVLDLTLDLKEARNQQQEDANNRFSELLVKGDDLEKTNVKLSNEIEGLLQRYEEAGQIVYDLNIQLEESRLKNDELVNEIERLRTSDNKAEVGVLKLENEVADLRQSSNNLESELKILKETNPRTAEQVSNLEKKLTDLQQANSNSESQLKTMGQDKIMAEQRILELDDVVSDLQKQKASLESQFQELEHKAASRAQENEELQNAIDNFIRERALLSKQLESSWAEVHDGSPKLLGIVQFSEKLKAQIAEMEIEREGLQKQLRDEKQGRLLLQENLAGSMAQAKSYKTKVAELKAENEEWKNEVECRITTCEVMEENVKKFQELTDALEAQAAEAETREMEVAEELEHMKASLTEAAVQFGLVSVEGEEVTPGGLWREFGEMKQRHTLLQSEMDDLRRAETLFEDMMKICAPGIDGSDYIKSYDGDYEELGTNFVKDLISSLRFRNYRQEVMIKTLRYHLTVFHKDILAQRGSLYTDMSYVDRAVVEKLSSLEDITTIHSDELSPWIGKPANNEGGLLLGQGSFGKVFLKRYRGAAVAVKVPYCKPVDRKDDDEDDEKIQARRKMNHARTIMEVRVHLFFDGHPSFSKLHGIVDVCGSPSLVIEFLGDKSTAEVHSLSHAVRLKTPSLSPDAWFDIVSDITNGVKALHEKGLLHNDLKSNNILLQRDQDEARWRGVIIDLGRVSTTILPRRHRSLPKEEQEAYRKGAVYQHLAPEHILDLEPTTVLIDIFSLGKLLGQIAGVVRNKVLLDLAAEMTSSKPYLRPSLKQIDKAIKKAKQKIRTQV